MEIDYDAQEIAAREIQGSERLLWCGRPQPLRLALSAVPMLVFAVPWTAFSVFWICGAAGFKVPDFRAGGFAFFPLFGLPFLLIGIAMLLSPLWAWRTGRRTIYAITDKRLLIIETGSSTSVRTLGPQGLDRLQRVDRSDGSGDLIFPTPGVPEGASGRSRGAALRLGFIGIPDVRTVHQIILDTFKV
jgi:hypothetical protein